MGRPPTLLHIKVSNPWKLLSKAGGLYSLAMTHYIHNINPVILQLGGPLAVRWYGISYLLGFLACILLMRSWSKKGEF